MLIKAHDEWQVAERRYISELSMAQTHPPVPTALALDAQHRQGGQCITRSKDREV